MPDLQPSDEELARRFLAGNLHAFESLVQRYSKPLYNFALNFLGDPDEADEAAQLVFVQVYQSLPRAHLDSPLKPWIYQIARNKCIDLWRARAPLSLSGREGHSNDDDFDPPAFDVADPSPALDELAEHSDLQRILREAIHALPPNYRMAVTLRYVNDLSFGEIAAVMKVPENTAKTYFQRAKKLLRQKLGEDFRRSAGVKNG
ncbi:MAG: RNA polymerase sigma factor [Chloroflexi bacterium]|nr:RNA polymerase sigma factor [Chloroflexota bacterium]MBI3733170.1 RNA polymerase sigma factor [Chloroflexota bacterium]